MSSESLLVLMSQPKLSMFRIRFIYLTNTHPEINLLLVVGPKNIALLASKTTKPHPLQRQPAAHKGNYITAAGSQKALKTAAVVVVVVVVVVIVVVVVAALLDVNSYESHRTTAAAADAKLPNIQQLIEAETTNGGTDRTTLALVWIISRYAT
uniref:Uncharacterized protein n=1 Tax=Glossina palpalis gambiensis TaxID=67801 RepID=A0A1B0BN89_9MUSC